MMYKPRIHLSSLQIWGGCLLQAWCQYNYVSEYRYTATQAVHYKRMFVYKKNIKSLWTRSKQSKGQTLMMVECSLKKYNHMQGRKMGENEKNESFSQVWEMSWRNRRLTAPCWWVMAARAAWPINHQPDRSRTHNDTHRVMAERWSSHPNVNIFLWEKFH